MRVLVVGGYGLIGGYVLARLRRDGWTIMGAGRDIAGAARRLPYASWVMVDLGRMRQPADWAHLLVEVDAVVNCAGALQDSPRDDLSAVHVEAAGALYGACVAAGVRRVVHVSAVGVSAGRETRFAETKRTAEVALEGLPLDWVILRPALVLAPVAYGGSALLRALAAFPFAIPAIAPKRTVQVVSAEDVAEAVARSVGPDAPSRMVVELADPAATTLAEVLIALRAWLGLPPAPVVAAPRAVAQIVAWAADALAFLGWRSPMRSTSLAQLAAGVVAGNPNGEPALGLKVKSLAEMLARWPSGVQERWFARLYLLKPALLVALIGFWLASGLIGLSAGHAQAVAALTAARLRPSVADATVDIGALVDIALALGVCVRPMAAAALKGMVAVSAAYLIGASLLRPDLWADPFGPLVKVVPAAVLALAALAILDER